MTGHINNGYSFRPTTGSGPFSGLPVPGQSVDGIAPNKSRETKPWALSFAIFLLFNVSRQLRNLYDIRQRGKGKPTL
jgi:hypothetical protein